MENVVNNIIKTILNKNQNGLRAFVSTADKFIKYGW